MAQVKYTNVQKYFGNLQVLKDVNFTIDDKKFVVLLGPSGCGKTTLLRMTAGLEDIVQGEINLDDKVMNQIHPRDRDIAMVFQNYALYPQMNVFDNIAFSLQIRKISKDEIVKKVHWAAEILNLTEYLKRLPKELSGGQRQRVAMGRALVRDPKVFLFDEPLSNLDAKLRVEMRHEIKKLYTTLKTTMVYVTHDQIEAMSLASKIAVMNKGIIQQLDEPQIIYDKPNSLFVADFIGSPSMNFIKGVLKKDSQSVIFIPNNENNIKLNLTHYKFQKNLQDDQIVVLGLRPEYVSNTENTSNSIVKLSLLPTIIETTGFDKNVTFDFAGTEIIGRFTPNSGVEINKKHDVYLDLSQISIFDNNTELRL